MAPKAFVGPGRRTVASLLPIGFLYMLAGCIPPMPVPKRVLAPDGATLQLEPDASSLRVGHTTRDEVRQAFAAVRVWDGDRVFIGRWVRSGLAHVTAEREWDGKNVLIAFDANERVERFDVCLDRSLLKHLPGYLSSETVRVEEASLRTQCPVQLERVENLRYVSLYTGPPSPARGSLDPAWVHLYFIMRQPSLDYSRTCVTDFPTLVGIITYLRDR